MVNTDIPGGLGLTRDPVSAFLQLVVSGRIGDPTRPGQALSQRGFARLVGISESTLRTAFRTEGRAPSARTLQRLDAALRMAPQSLFFTRTGNKGVRTDTLTPLGQRYYRSTRPEGARSFRIVVRSSDPEYEYQTLMPMLPGAQAPEDFFGDYEDQGLSPVRVIWDVE